MERAFSGLPRRIRTSVPLLLVAACAAAPAAPPERPVDPPGCGPRPTKGNGGEGPFGIDMLPAPDAHGYAGTYTVGPAIPSFPARGLTPEEASATVVELRAANRPRVDDGAPGESVLGPAERAAWCERLVPLAKARLGRAGDVVSGDGACAVSVRPEGARQIVPDVKVRFDTDFFFRKPYAAASYDRDARTLFLPIASVAQPWDELAATRHEWLHARHHALALRGDATALALASVVRGPEYRPDGFWIDEVPVNVCDLLRVEGEPGPQRIGMAERYVGILQRELDAMRRSKAAGTESRAGMPGVRLAADGGVERWIGGRDRDRSTRTLERIARDAAAALERIKARDLAGARAVPLFAAGVCDPVARRLGP